MSPLPPPTDINTFSPIYAVVQRAHAAWADAHTWADRAEAALADLSAEHYTAPKRSDLPALPNNLHQHHAAYRYLAVAYPAIHANRLRADRAEAALAARVTIEPWSA